MREDPSVAGVDTVGGGRLAHEPPEPGWWPRPPDAVLRESRLERHRRRQLVRLAVRRPQLHAAIVRMQAGSRRFWDGVLPRERVLPVTVAVLALTLFDALATLVLVGSGTAEEANPLLARVIEEIGLPEAMVLRMLVGGVFTLALAWLSTWRREARPMLVFVAVLLSLVAGLHVIGLAWTFA